MAPATPNIESPRVRFLVTKYERMIPMDDGTVAAEPMPYKAPETAS